MVTIDPSGNTIIESGDPDFQTIVIGNPDPQNQIIDPDPTKPVSQLVFETFNIPFSLPVLGGDLAGLDIRNQDATTMLKVSLAAELRDPPNGNSGFAEVELDEFGIGRFYMVGADDASNLDIRYCIPTGQITNPADLVIVRGYDPPVTRELRTSFDGLKNKEIMAYEDCATDSCDEEAVKKYATLTYDDPALDQTYLDDIVNSYELQAFESILGYIIDLDMPIDNEDVPGLKITFGDTTKEYIKIDSVLFSRSAIDVDTIGLEDFQQHTRGTVIGAGEGGGSPVPSTITTVNETTGECTDSETTLIGSSVVLLADRFRRLNKFGRYESDFLGVVDVVFSGQKIVLLQVFGGAAGINGRITVYVRPRKELVSLQHGKNWTWTEQPNGNVEIELFSMVDSDIANQVCTTYTNPESVVNANAPSVELRVVTTDDTSIAEEEGREAFDPLVCNIGDVLGYRAVNGEMCLVIERRRPSIDVFDPRGTAAEVANQITVTYTPIILVDEPAPIGYASTSSLSSIDGTKTIAAEGIIDQADGIIDADPSTTQDLEDSELSILQDNTSGSTIDITLPFCIDTECLQIARNFLGLQNRVVSTTSMVLGPDSTPRLGQRVIDSGGNDSIINDISYSYTDASQYLITVTTGPEFQGAGSFNDSKYQLKTEEVTREGVIIQDAGNGAEYTVLVEGFGELVALSMILEDISVGDKCQVRIYNNPVEHI